MEPRDWARRIEETAALPEGKTERFSGYAVMGLPFRSGHVLALRRFPASSLGPGYTSVWHRTPEGRWTFYSTVDPERSCSRYFGAQVNESVYAPTRIDWHGPRSLRITVDAPCPLVWDVLLTETAASRAMNAAARMIPDPWWQRRFMLRAMGAAARAVLGTGRINLAGRTPNGYEFIANPRHVWPIEWTRATLGDQDFGRAGPLERQATLNDFLIPQRGIFAVARAFLQTAAG